MYCAQCQRENPAESEAQKLSVTSPATRAVSIIVIAISMKKERILVNYFVIN